MIRRFIKPGVIIALAIAISAGVLFSGRQKIAPVHAQFEVPYDGERLFTLTCTCSANLLEYILDYRTMTVDMLVYQPGVSMLYRELNPYGLYLLGSYVPGAGACMIQTGSSCTQVQSTGQMGSAPGSGTSQ